jgi:hypothetical protein
MSMSGMGAAIGRAARRLRRPLVERGIAGQVLGIAGQAGSGGDRYRDGMTRRRLQLGLLAFLSIGVALVAPAPWLLGLFHADPGNPPLVVHLIDRHAAAQAVFVLHVVGGGGALLVGPFQLMHRLRAKRPGLHRATGYAYVTAVAVGGATGLVMGVRAFGGPVAQLGFTALALAWLGTTALGLQRILAGDRAGHRAWITRSFALAFAAVSLRIQVPIAGVLGIPTEIAYPVIAWSCWVPNLLVVGVRPRTRALGTGSAQPRTSAGTPG